VRKMLHKIKRQKQITNVYKGYKVGIISAQSAEKTLVGKCSVNCLICQHAFFKDGWCSTMAIDNCMYFDKSISNFCQTNIRYVDEDKLFKDRLDKAKLLLTDKGFLTVSMLQRKLKVTNKVASEILECIQ